MYFDNASHLERLINAYFDHIKGDFHFEDLPLKNNNDDLTEKKKVWDRPMEPVTISGLALFLGFDSVEALTCYTIEGLFATEIKRALLRIETTYEQKLHNGSASGAIFALKKLGWNQPKTEIGQNTDNGNLNVNVKDSGILVAGNEDEVAL